MTVPLDLARFEVVAKALPDDPEVEETAVLSRRNLPRPPAHLATDRVVVYRGGSSYNESELGTRGVAAWSHELRLRLPGSATFQSSGLPDL